MPARPTSALHAAVADLDPDSLSPRQAQEALYALKALLAGDPATQQDGSVAAPRDPLS
jgi:hypothetical protein